MRSDYFNSHIIDLLFVISFLICLCIPNLHLSPAEKSEEENRMLAKYVPLTYDKKINWNYGADFEKFYNDRFYCRRKLIYLNSSVKEKISPVSVGTTAMKGKDGWLFYRGGNSELNFLNYDLITEGQLVHGLQYLTDIKNWCDANGKVFVFLICPDKNKIYGEYYPDGYKKVRPDTESRAFQFINYVRANSDISVIYPYNELIAEKSSGRLLYHKNDTHWNYDGAYIAYKEFIKEIQKNIDIEQVVNDGFEEYKCPQGDLNNLFPEIKFIPDEETIYYSPKINLEYENLVEESYDGQIVKAQLLHHTVCKSKKHKAIFFRDSFCAALSKFTSNTFGEVVYHWRHNITSEDLAYIKDNTDVVVLECVERDLPGVIAQSFPQIDLNNTEAEQ